MDKFDKMDFSSIEFLWGENEYDLLSKKVKVSIIYFKKTGFIKIAEIY